MQINWRGQSCFEITAAGKNNGEKVNIVIDPFDESIGLKLPSLEADILLVTHDHSDHNNIKAVKSSSSQVSDKFGRTGPFLINGPGEYEVKGVFIQGISVYHDKVFGKERGRCAIYTIEAEDIRVCHLADIGQDLTDELIEKIGNVDVLMIPIGGVFTIDARQAVKMMSEIEPKIIIPMHYDLPAGKAGLPKLKIKPRLDGLDKFLKALGIKSLPPQDKLVLKKKDLSEDEVKVIALNP